MWIHNWNADGTEVGVYYRTNGKLYSKKYLTKNRERIGQTEKLYDYKQTYFYETGEKSSTFEGYMDLQCRSYAHGFTRAFTPSGLQYATGKSRHGKVVDKTINRNLESLLSANDRRVMEANINEVKPLLVPKVVWERAMGVNKHSNPVSNN